MRASRKNSRTKVISFSGIDGAGKSTQIQSLRARMENMGLRVQSLQFWDDVAMFTRFREATSHALFKGDKGVGTPLAPVTRRDKNVRSWLMSGVRLCLYLADAVSARSLVKKMLHSGKDVIIFDRYIYDQLANLNLRNPFMRAYAMLLMKFVPQPDISYYLDANPIQAQARKPEYPTEFLHTCRASYLALSELSGRITVIAPMPVREVEQEVLRHVLKELSFADGDTKSGPAADTLDGTYESATVNRPYSRPSVS
jgi:thymidylate kinase